MGTRSIHPIQKLEMGKIKMIREIQCWVIQGTSVMVREAHVIQKKDHVAKPVSAGHGMVCL